MTVKFSSTPTPLSTASLVTQEQAMEAVKTLIQWAGDDPEREGLLGTPERVVKSYKEYFSGYAQDPKALLERTFAEVGGYNELVMLRNIRFESHCEHHLTPIIGVIHVAYLPDKRVVGISKLARVVDIFTRRMQIQEKLTAQIADTIDQALSPRGVAVLVEATHHCMSNRGIHKAGATMITSRMTGVFKSDDLFRRDFMAIASSTPYTPPEWWG